MSYENEVTRSMARIELTQLFILHHRAVIPSFENRAITTCLDAFPWAA